MQLDRDTLLTTGMPAQAIAGVAGFIEGIRQGYFESDRSDLEYLLGWQPDDMRTIIKAFI